MNVWFSGPPVAAPHGQRGGTVLEKPDHDTVLSWPAGHGPVDPRDIVVQGPRTRARYCDQSHMTAEFRRLMGAPPAAFRAGHWPAPEQCVNSPNGQPLNGGAV